MVNNQLAMGFLVLNILALILFGADKSFARRRMWRIPETVLLGIAVLGGSIGAYIGMQVFRHKTRKPMFRIGIPVVIIVQAALVVWYCSSWILR